MKVHWLASVSPAGQLSAGQRCAAVLRCPGTLSDSVWTARCYVMRGPKRKKKKEIVYNGKITDNTLSLLYIDIYYS